jgi:hypothetical protein
VLTETHRNCANRSAWRCKRALSITSSGPTTSSSRLRILRSRQFSNLSSRTEKHGIVSCLLRVCVCVCVCVCMCVCVQGCIVVWIRAARTVLCEIFLRIRPLPHGVEVEVVAARVRLCRARALRMYARRVRVCTCDVKNNDEHACGTLNE